MDRFEAAVHDQVDPGSGGGKGRAEGGDHRDEGGEHREAHEEILFFESERGFARRSDAEAFASPGATPSQGLRREKDSGITHARF